MARFLYCLAGASGHLGPTLPVVRALRARGHAVAVLTHARCRAAVTGAGGELIAPSAWAGTLAGHDYSPPPARLHLQYLLRNRHLILHGFFTEAPAQFRDMAAAIEAWRPDVVLGNEGTPGAWMAAEKLGVAWAFSSVLAQCYLPSNDLPIWGAGTPPAAGPWGLRAMRLRNVVMRQLLRPLVRKMDDLRTAHGLPALALATHFDYSGLGQLYLVPGTTDFDYPRGDLPDHVHYVGPCLWHEPTDQAWTNPFGDARFVYGTAGTVFNHPRFFRTLIDAARGARFNLFITTGNGFDRRALGALPANVAAASYVPQHLLWPHVSAMFTSASDGGVMGALVHAVPLVVSPMLGVQYDTARRCQHAGVGELIEVGALTPRRVRAALDRVLDDPGYRARAEALAARLGAHDGPEAAATLLERLAQLKRRVTARDLIAASAPAIPPPARVAPTQEHPHGERE